MTPYRSAAKAATAEFIIKKSRFIGRIAPVQSAAEAEEFIAQIKKQHRDAAHNCWAYSLRDGQMRYSDEGEPQGTAGLPILDVLQKKNLLDCAVVVTRYFGGILLGAGGLVRAYSQAASEAVNAAGIALMTPCQVLQVVCDYGFYGTLQRLLPSCGAEMLSADFMEEITVTLRLRAELAEVFSRQLSEKSNGSVIPSLLCMEMVSAESST